MRAVRTSPPVRRFARPILPTLAAVTSIALLFTIGCVEIDSGSRLSSPPNIVPIADKSGSEPSIAMADLAGDVTFLEDEIHRAGSITIKQPDVWGDADLMGYIQEYEQVMINRLGDFKDTIQGYLARSDQADLQSMTSMGLNLGPSTGAPPTPFSTFNSNNSNNSANSAVTPVSIPTTSSLQAPQGQVFDVLNQALSNTNASPTAKFSLEPTESLRQNSTYLKVNQGLRRINSGADSAQAAGYGLYLLRVPVSILPGRRTRQGYSGVVTMRAQMVIDPDHLRVTFPKLVFGDLADQLLRIFEDHWRDDNLPNDTSNATCTPTSKMRPPRLNGMMRSSSLTLSNPVTTQQFDNLYGYDQMNCLFQTVKGNLAQTKATAANPPRDELRKWLVSYFSGMYDQLKERQLLSGHPYHFIPQISMMYARGDKAALTTMRTGWERMAGPGTELASAGWMLIAQAAVLDRQLKDSIKDVKLSGHLAFGCDDALVDRAEFANPCPPPETQTQELWSAFIQSQYPIHIFELDPDIEEQNIYDAFSQRRELQLAIAFAVANGSLRADQAIKYTRQMALDMTTIDLNRTQVGFVHENDTFGWYFYPRVQAIDPEHSTFASCFKTLFCGGFTRDDELRQRRLEPGIRECEVLVVMPNFVPELKLDITTNWEKLTRPGNSKLGYNEMIDLGAQVEGVKHRATNVRDAHCYRPGDYERLVSRIDQLEKMLPLQTYSVTVPYQYDLPGSQLFDKGAASLSPEITGYYGLSWIKRGSSTIAQFYLAGHHFHPTRTSVVIGGTEVHSTFQVLQVATTPSSGQVVQSAGQTVSTSLAGKSGSGSPSGTTAGSASGGTQGSSNSGSSASGTDAGGATGNSAGSGTNTRSGAPTSSANTESRSTAQVVQIDDASTDAQIYLAAGKSTSGGSGGKTSGSGSGSSGHSGGSSGGSSTGSGGSGGSSEGGSSGSGSSGGSSGGGGSGSGGSGSGSGSGGGSNGSGGGSNGGSSVPAATQTVSTSQTTAANGLTMQWTTQQVQVISRDLLRITVSSISPELSSGPIPVRVATPAGLSNEFYIDQSPYDTPPGPSFSLINPIITFPFSINTTKSGVVVNPVPVASGFELKATTPTGSTISDVQIKLSIPSTNASTTIAYKLSDNTGAAAIDGWLQDQCTSALNKSLNFTNPNATPEPIAVNVSIAPTTSSGTTPASVTLSTPLQLQPKLLLAANAPTVPSPSTPTTASTTPTLPPITEATSSTVPPMPASTPTMIVTPTAPAATTAGTATLSPPSSTTSTAAKPDPFTELPAAGAEGPPASAPVPAPSATEPPARVKLTPRPAPPAEPSTSSP
jgi:hypothetical protein